MVIDENLSDKVRVTVIATGFGEATNNPKGIIPGVYKTSADELGGAVRKAVSSSTSAAPSEVIKLKKLSVLSTTDDDDKFEIPTFLIVLYEIPASAGMTQTLTVSITSAEQCHLVNSYVYDIQMFS